MEFEMNNIIKGSSNISSSISNLNIPSKLKKMFKLSKFPLIATFSFDPTITAGIDMLYAAGEGIINHIEVQNLKVFLQEYIDRKIDDCISLENQEEREFIIQSITKSLRCSKEAQVKRIVDIVQATLKNDEMKFDEAEDFINIVSELSEREAVLLASVYNHFTSSPAHPKFTVEDESVFGNLPHNSWDYLLNRLEGKGLLNSEPTAASWEEMDEVFKANNSESIAADNSNKQDLVLNMKTYFQTDFGSKLFKSLRSENLK